MRGKGGEGDVVDRIISKLKGMLKGQGVPDDSTITADTTIPEIFCIVDGYATFV